MRKKFIMAVAATSILFSCQSKQEEVVTSAPEPEVVIDEHNARNSLDYLGTYKGVLPCADCEGIETTITLNKDETYTKQTKYLGKSAKVEEELGDFTWLEDGNRMSLEGIDTPPVLYFVAENKLIQLDKDGNQITGNLAKNYELTKQN